ncbi:MAG: 4-alpha-glucanotransferase [Dysgonamonadaceae bacterium]|jgi:4-alpha-glucanotransferase|nr:4-alpha-glucanotransferase [Dysgonamonadaceae bacterium]
MRISFNINFHTIWGQTLHITGSIPELGEWNIPEAKELIHTGNGNWSFELELPDGDFSFEYRYFVRSGNRLIFEEWEKNHKIDLTTAEQSYELLDYWQNRPRNMAFYSSAFIKSLFAHPCDKFERVVKSKKKILLKVLAPYIAPNQSLALLGNQKEMGNWDAGKALILSCENFPEWWVEFDASQLQFPVEYKFCIINNEDKSIVRWEKGDNRTLPLPYSKDNGLIILSGLQFRDEEPNWKCAGLSIPVFSLRSENSFGIGDFGDLRQMVNWVKLTGQRIIQILPVNDTTASYTWLDSYPYNAISIFALHPLYLNMEAMGELKAKKRKEFYKKKQKELNALPVVDYDSVSRFKRQFFHELYEQDGEETLASEAFSAFFHKNEDWLIPYAAYSFLRDKNGTADFHQWKEYAVYNPALIKALCRPEAAGYKTVAFYYYLQFHLDKQLTGVRNYCHSQGIVLKGDIPIGISKISIEAWTEPACFNTRFQTGAPPDDFSVTGQNWGFPTYNWEAMEANQFEWWKKRFRKMADYFDAYRIDHILGFFRIWEIPDHSIEGLLGYFSPALPFSREEIEYSGLKFDKEKLTRAAIHEQNLPKLFGKHVSEVKQKYLKQITSDHYILKSPFDTQRKIRDCFAGKEDEENRQIKAGLFAICNEVLFIEDKNSDHYHPRISAASSFIYRELDNQNKYAFDYLYRDYFYQRHNEFWKEQAYKCLTPLINSTDMLVCGEDLGMIPQSVPEVIRKLQILSLEIERMPKLPGTAFTPLKHNPYLSVCTTSTHDMPVIRGWWKENKAKTQQYYNETLKREGVAPAECTPEICEQIISNHLLSGSMLCIIPFQDWLSIDETLRNPDPDAERINIPARPRHYWQYRMHLTIEELMKAEKLNEKIKRLTELRS